MRTGSRRRLASNAGTSRRRTPARSTAAASGPPGGQATTTSCSSRSDATRRRSATSAPLQAPVWLTKRILTRAAPGRSTRSARKRPSAAGEQRVRHQSSARRCWSSSAAGSARRRQGARQVAPAVELDDRRAVVEPVARQAVGHDHAAAAQPLEDPERLDRRPARRQADPRVHQRAGVLGRIGRLGGGEAVGEPQVDPEAGALAPQARDGVEHLAARAGLGRAQAAAQRGVVVDAPGEEDVGGALRDGHELEVELVEGAQRDDVHAARGGRRRGGRGRRVPPGSQRSQRTPHCASAARPVGLRSRSGPAPRTGWTP